MHDEPTDPEEQAMKQLAELVNGTFFEIASIYGARKIIDLKSGRVDNINLEGETVSNVVEVNGGTGKPPILIIN